MERRRQLARKRNTWGVIGRWIIAAVVVVGAAGAAWYFYGGGKQVLQASAASTGPDYHTATAALGNIEISASGSGTLIAAQSVDLSFPIKGTVTELNVKAGDTVKVGQVLAQLGNSQALQTAIAADQLQLLQAQKALNDLQQGASVSLAQAYQSWVKAQQTYQTAVTADQRTAYSRCSKQVDTQYAAALDRAQQKLDTLTKYNYGTDQWISVKATYDQALANYNYCVAYTAEEKTNAQANVDVAKNTMQQDEQVYTTLKAASGIDPTQLALDEAKVQQAQTQLAQDQQNLQGITLTSPIDGVVISVASGKGSMVDTSAYITVADLSKPRVLISIDETDLNLLTSGSNAQVTFDALPDQTFTGTVTQIYPQLTKSGQYQVVQAQVELAPDAAQALSRVPLGLNASVTVIVKQARNATIVPIQALRDLGDKQYAVFTVGPGGSLHLQPVQVGLTDSTRAQIVSGLKPGDVVSTGVAQTK